MGLFNFGKKASSSNAQPLRWQRLDSEQQLNEWIDASHEKPVMFFKHSTRCSISSMALSRLENYWNLNDEEVTPVYLDLIQYRPVSNKMAELLNITHQSPQILLVKNGECIYNASHNQIDVEGVKQNL
jgi:bacillithiol system protein YtxJ